MHPDTILCTVGVERVLQDGFETVEAALPAVVTISNELGEPRSPNLRQVMRAARKQAVVWSAADLGLDASQVGATGARLTVERLFVPVQERQCEFINGDSPQELADAGGNKLSGGKSAIAML